MFARILDKYGIRALFHQLATVTEREVIFIFDPDSEIRPPVAKALSLRNSLRITMNGSDGYRPTTTI